MKRSPLPMKHEESNEAKSTSIDNEAKSTSNEEKNEAKAGGRRNPRGDYDPEFFLQRLRDLASNLNEEDRAIQDEALLRLAYSRQSNEELDNIRIFREQRKLSETVELALRLLSSGQLQQFFLQAEENETMQRLSKRSGRRANMFLNMIGQLDGSAQRIARRLWEIDNELESNELLRVCST